MSKKTESKPKAETHEKRGNKRCRIPEAPLKQASLAECNAQNLASRAAQKAVVARLDKAAAKAVESEQKKIDKEAK